MCMPKHAGSTWSLTKGIQLGLDIMVTMSLQCTHNYKINTKMTLYPSQVTKEEHLQGATSLSLPPPICKGLFKKLLLICLILSRLIEEDRRSHQFGVNLCIQPGVADKVDDPSLSFLG